MLAPMTVKNIPITMAIVIQLMTWIVATARFEILQCMDYLTTRKHFRDQVELAVLVAHQTTS